MKLIDSLFRNNKMPKVLEHFDRTIFQKNLDERCDELGIEKSQPIPIRISKFLIVGCDIVRQSRGYESLQVETDLDECSAFANLIIQGIHQFMMEKNGESNRHKAEYKAEWVLLFEFTLAGSFGWDRANPNNRGVEILTRGSELNRELSARDTGLQQRCCNAWADFLVDINDTTVAQMESVYVEILAFVRR